MVGLPYSRMKERSSLEVCEQFPAWDYSNFLCEIYQPTYSSLHRISDIERVKLESAWWNFEQRPWQPLSFDFCIGHVFVMPQIGLRMCEAHSATSSTASWHHSGNAVTESTYSKCEVRSPVELTPLFMCMLSENCQRNHFFDNFPITCTWSSLTKAYIVLSIWAAT